jgi:2-dehydropantoate 2-reductase
VINPITAIENIRNGELDFEGSVVCGLVSEIAEVYEANRFGISRDDIDSAIRLVASNTRENYSSMCVDLNIAKRPTEIEFMNGYISSLSSKVGIECPINDYLISSIKKPG